MAYEDFNADFVKNYHERAQVAFDKLEDAEKTQAIDAINAATADKTAGPGKIFGAVLGVIGKFTGLALAFAVVFILSGCFKDDDRATKGHLTENKALAEYVSNNDALIESLASSKREIESAIVQTNFERSVAQITSHADAQGKVDAKETADAVLKWDQSKKAALDKIELEIARIYFDRDTAKIPLAQMYEIRSALERYHSAGANPEMVNNLVDSVVTNIGKIGPKTKKPVTPAPVVPKAVNMVESKTPAIAFAITRAGRADEIKTIKSVWTRN